MKKVTNMLEVHKIQEKNERKRVKEVTRLTTSQINELRIKSIFGIGSGVFILALGGIVRQLGINLTPAELEALTNSPELLESLFNIFGVSLTALGASITAVSTKRAVDRAKIIKELKEERRKIKEEYKVEKITSEEKQKLKSMKVQRNR